MQSFSRFRSTVTVLLFSWIFATVAMAHPGHGAVPEVPGPMHYLLSPSHWGVVALIVVLAVAMVARSLQGVVMRLLRRS